MTSPLIRITDGVSDSEGSGAAVQKVVRRVRLFVSYFESNDAMKNGGTISQTVHISQVLWWVGR